ncbi:bZIP transcription factor 16 [Setaria italica]|uniref:bZIP transcription factor 16 n=1 Tax=Setaria italica TaxID=4555 RepID=UPI000BE5818E|nr:bZIP transcription factor 16 [Setaria italica]
MSDDSDGQRQCRRGVTVDVELDAAMALADMAGVGPAATPGGGNHPRSSHQAAAAAPPTAEGEDDLASTRLSLELGKVGIQSASPCSSSSSAGHPHPQPSAQHQPHPVPEAAATGYGPRPRHTLTEAEKEAKRLRRVLANRESARQTILRRQAIRDELARKVVDLSSQNENMKKEKDMVMQEYLSLKEANKQLKEQAHHHHHHRFRFRFNPVLA